MEKRRFQKNPRKKILVFLFFLLTLSPIFTQTGGLLIDVERVKKRGDLPGYMENVVLKIFRQVVGDIDELSWTDPSYNTKSEGTVIPATLTIEKRGDSAYTLTLTSRTRETLTSSTQSLELLKNSVRTIINGVLTKWAPAFKDKSVDLYAAEVKKVVVYENLGNGTREALYFIPPLVSFLLHDYMGFSGFRNHFLSEQSYSSAIQTQLTTATNIENLTAPSDKYAKQSQGFLIASYSTGYLGPITTYILNPLYDEKTFSMTTFGAISYTVGLTLMQAGGMAGTATTWRNKGIDELILSNNQYKGLVSSVGGATASSLNSLITPARSNEIEREVEVGQVVTQALWLGGMAFAVLGASLPGKEEHFVLTTQEERVLHSSGLTTMALAGTLLDLSISLHYQAVAQQTSKTLSDTLYYSSFAIQLGGLIMAIYPIINPKKARVKDKDLKGKNTNAPSVALLPAGNGGAQLYISLQY